MSVRADPALDPRGAPAGPDLPAVTVVVPVLDEERHLRACVESLLAGADYPERLLEVLLVDGGSTDRSREIARELAAERPGVRLLDNPRRIQSAAMNIGLAEARGEVIVRADAHATYSPGYVREAVELLRSSGAANVGGVWRPVGTTWFGRAVAIAMTSRFGAGGARFLLASEPEWVDTVPFGAWRREALARAGGFDEAWVVGEDLELNLRLRRAGGRVLLAPSLRAEYRTRDTPAALARQFARYGFWRARLVLRHPELARQHRFLSPALAAGMAGSAALLAVGSLWGLALPSLYATAALGAAAVACARERSWRHAPAVAAAFATMQLANGFGFLWGLARWTFRS